MMTTKLYVGNMSYNTQERDLVDLFDQFGDVVAINIITDKTSFRSKGFAFIEMNNKWEAKKAVTSLNDTVWMDRKINVNLAKTYTNYNNISNRLYLP